MRKKPLPEPLKGKTASAWDVLKRTADIISEEPRRVEMMVWQKKVPVTYSPCGTVGCIAGWAAVAMGKDIPEHEVNDTGDIVANALGLDLSQQSTLFHPFTRPGYKSRTADGPTIHGIAAWRHLWRFMYTHEAQLKATRVKLGGSK